MKKVTFRILEFIRFFFNSKSHFSVHSPFLFDFIEIFSKKADSQKELAFIFSYKKKIVSNCESIEIHDFGTGKRSNNTYITSIKKQAKRSLKNDSDIIILYNIVNKIKPKNILELGTSFGVSTLTMSIANPNCSIKTFEGCPNISKKAEALFKEAKVSNIQIVVGNINTTLYDAKQVSEPFDLVFIDANHTYVDTLKYFFHIKTLLNKNSLIIFDDIHWSKEMNKAWKSIIEDTDITLSVETWNFGFVFFNNDLSKQHFILRKF